MRFLQVALLFTFVMMFAIGAKAQLDPDSCTLDAHCYNEDVDCYCIGPSVGLPGHCECTGLGHKGLG